MTQNLTKLDTKHGKILLARRTGPTLENDAATVISRVLLGSSIRLQNSRCTFEFSQGCQTVKPSYALSARLSLASGGTPVRTVFVRADDRQQRSSGWQALGQIQTTGTAASDLPFVQEQAFAIRSEHLASGFTVSVPTRTWSSLTFRSLLVASELNGVNACSVNAADVVLFGPSSSLVNVSISGLGGVKGVKHVWGYAQDTAGRSGGWAHVASLLLR